MHCIVGLGNPESRYSLTRHNIGFQITDRLAERLDFSFRKGRGEFLFAKGIRNREPLLVVKPVTYMNRSGQAVRQVIDYYDIPYEDILIILDDLDLPFGTLRFRPGGSDGGNKGMKSIISQTGTREIPRFRFGIRNRDNIANPSRYVLSNFNRKERSLLPGLFETVDEALDCWMNNGIQETMNRFNKRLE